MNQDIIGRCWQCGRDLSKADYGREALCLGCGKATRVCRNCRHRAPGKPNDCREPMAEEVLNKERANFCEFFDPGDRHAGVPKTTSAAELLKRANDLFK